MSEFDWAANPDVKFPYQKELEEAVGRFKYLLKLADNWNYFLNLGMDPVDAEALIRSMESKNLSLENYRYD